jgi:poly-gamma-glutamate capsule biosynthesis protein CapA/YwtB (metallophosphatase superfamily)
MRAAVATGCLLLLVACSTPTESTPAPGPAPSSRSVPSPEPTTSAEPDPPTSEPLVFAVHVRRPPADLTRRQAGLLLDGGVRQWSQLGLEGGRLSVIRKPAALRSLAPDTVAVVPASKVGPGVRVLSVEGVDPLRHPADYAIRAAGPEPGRVTTLTIVGDIMLGRRVGERAAAEGDPAYPLRPMQRRLRSADITVGNLESTLSADGSPTQGGDSFAADPAVRAGLRDAGFDAIGLANNHLGDFGDDAIVETVQRLRAAGLDTFGAGASPTRAQRPVILERHGVRFGFLGFNAIGETPEVAPGRPGAVSVSMPPRTGPLDRAELDRFVDAVRRLDRRVDVVTVLPHWGTQYTQRPEPIQGAVAGELVAAGADLVVGGHPHWVQGASLRGDALVVHSLGNFVFDMDFMRETREGLVLEAVFWGGELKAAEFVPYVIGDDFAPRVVSPERARANLDLFWQFSRIGASPR